MDFVRTTVRSGAAGMGAGAGSQFEEEAALGAGNMINTAHKYRYDRSLDTHASSVIRTSLSSFLTALPPRLRGGAGGWETVAGLVVGMTLAMVDLKSGWNARIYELRTHSIVSATSPAASWIGTALRGTRRDLVSFVATDLTIPKIFPDRVRRGEAPFAPPA